MANAYVLALAIVALAIVTYAVPNGVVYFCTPLPYPAVRNESLFSLVITEIIGFFAAVHEKPPFKICLSLKRSRIVQRKENWSECTQ